MKKIYLCGHTGSQNRGCEAILRSTAAVLRQVGEFEIAAMTFDLEYDRFLRVDECIKLIPYPKKPSVIRAMSLMRRKLLNDGIWGNRYIYKRLFKQIDKNDIIFNVGGDVYCYKTPYLSYALNELAEENDIATVFWCCSVDERMTNDEVMLRDINRYKHIVARETLTHEMMKQNVSDSTRLWKTCDPAFWLETRETELPKGFVEGNTVGINLSPLVFSDYMNEEDNTYQNIRCLIDYILSNTDMNVCMIPHVYCVEKNTQDIKVLNKVYSWYANNERVSIVNTELSCTQLKYIISKCRFFVGARTHSTIAAYSTAVPTIVLSYSVKSIGIAMDLFGTSEGYAVPWEKLFQKDDLLDIFKNLLLKNESKIKARYEEVLPEYKKSIIDTTSKMLKGFENK